MTLTFKLIRDIVNGNVHAEFQVRISNGSAVRVLTDGQTNKQTDGTDFIPSTADAGGNNIKLKFSITKKFFLLPIIKNFLQYRTSLHVQFDFQIVDHFSRHSWKHILKFPLNQTFHLTLWW